MGQRPKVIVSPPVPGLREAVIAGGGDVIDDPSAADAVVWVNPADPDGLRALLEASPARWVQLPFAGIESFFAAGVLDRDRTWTCAKGIYGPACAEQALALLLTAARRLHQHARTRGWQPGDALGPHRRVAGTTALVVGTGGIGQPLARMLAPLDVRIIALNTTGRPMPGADRTEPVSALRALLPEADWVVLCAALTERTRHMIDADALSAMKPDAWLINVARGGLVDQDALVSALDEGRIGGAALDVTEPEPLPDDHPLWDLENVIITSHTANTAAMALPELQAMVQRNVARFAVGETLEGLVDVDAGY